MCDKILLTCESWPVPLRCGKNKYDILAIFKFCTDTFCTPARFGQLAHCPFCTETDPPTFRLTHVAKCSDFMLLCIELLQPSQVYSLLDLIRTEKLSDKRLWLLLVLLHAHKPKTRKLALDLFAIVSACIASGLSNPNVEFSERVHILNTRLS